MIQAIKKYAVLRDVIERCDEVVRARLRENTIREADIALESFQNGGKRLRPALLVLCSQVPRGDGIGHVAPGLVDLAGAVELVHLATLFHDDVIDEVDHRRTKQSARLKYGNYASVLTGDFALAEALELVHRSQHPEAMPEFIRTLRVLVRGESLETLHKFDYGLTEAQYYDIISEKSASLFALSCKAPVVGGAPEYADVLGHFGWNLGMAFQMIDDLDDMLDSPARSDDCDLRAGYLALPMIRVLSTLTDGHRERLVRIIDDADLTEQNQRFIASLCMELGAFGEAHQAIHKHLESARASLDRFGDGEAVTLLRKVTTDLAAYADAQLADYSGFANRMAS